MQYTLYSCDFFFCFLLVLCESTSLIGNVLLVIHNLHAFVALLIVMIYYMYFCTSLLRK